MAFLKEVAFGVDDFNKPKLLTPQESLAQILYNIFVMEEGTYPSLPHIGIGIRRYLYKYREDINITELKQKIFVNCTDLLPFVEFDDIDIIVTNYQNQGIMMIMIPLKITDETMLLAFSTDDKNEILFRFQVESIKLNTI